MSMAAGSKDKVPAPSAEDAALVARLRANDDAAYGDLLRTHGGRMLATARRILGNDADAADALQDALFSVSRNIGSFSSESRLGTWLHRVAVNAALMRLRSRKSQHVESIEDLLPTFIADGHHKNPPRPWHVDETNPMAREETFRLVRNAIDRLPNPYRIVVLLRDIEELDTAEVAEQLGITSNAVKVRLHRGRQVLRTLLDSHFGALQS